MSGRLKMANRLGVGTGPRCYSRTRGLRLLSTPWTLLGRGVGTNGAVVPRDSSVGGQGHQAFTDGTQTPLALNHRASPFRSLHVFSLHR